MVAINRQTAAIALGGGGARGLAHIGVIEVLQGMNLDIKRLVGVSMGALAGAVCAVHNDANQARKAVIEYLQSEGFQSKQAALFDTAPSAEEPATSGLFAWYNEVRRYLGARRKLATLLSQPALLGADVLQDTVDALLPDIDIRDTRIPLTVVALDLLSGKEVQLSEGSLKLAVMASAAIPGVFPPVETDGMLLCDVGMLDAIPARVARSFGCDLTIAVDVGAEIEPVTECKTAIDIFIRLTDISEPLLRKYTEGIADLLIRPEVAHLPWNDFSDPADLIERGRAATRRLLISDKSSPSAESNRSLTVRPASRAELPDRLNGVSEEGVSADATRDNS